MSDERFDYQQQLEEDRRRWEEYELARKEAEEVHRRFMESTRKDWSFHTWPSESIK